MTLLKPPKLQLGDTIGIVATSFPYPTPPTGEYYDWFIKGKADLESMGFKTKLGKNLKKVKWWFAGTAQERAADINSMFVDPQVKAIIVHDGGQSGIAVLEHIDYELVKKNPKPFIGFSDITNFHLAFYSKCNMVGFHMGLLSYTLGWVWHYLVKDKKQIIVGRKYVTDILTSNTPLGIINPITEWSCWRRGKISGKLFGGNLSTLTSLLGTDYFPSFDKLKGCILFWEIDKVKSYRIEKHLYQLKYAGLLEIISGMIIGKLMDIKRTAWKGYQEPTLKELVLETLKDYSFPILADVDFGHKIVNIPMPIGITAKIDADKTLFELIEPAVL